MTTTRNFLFKESEYDFDDVLFENGYEIKFDREEVVMFSKKINVDNEYSKEHRELFEMVIPFSIDIQRPKMLSSIGKYDLCSPYLIVCNYYTKPLYANRQFSWSVFPGSNKQILSKMLQVVEREALDIFKTFMRTDIEMDKQTK